MKTVLAGNIGFPAENLTIAEKVVLITELGFFRSKREERLGKEVRCNVHRFTTRATLVLISNLSTFTAQIERTNGRFGCVL